MWCHLKVVPITTVCCRILFVILCGRHLEYLSPLLQQLEDLIHLHTWQLILRVRRLRQFSELPERISSHLCSVWSQSGKKI
jgi:hypothetical protein